MIGDTPTGYLLWHPQTNRFMNSRHARCNEKMVYKSLKESPEKPEIRISENTEKSEMSEEKTLTLIRDHKSHRYQSFPSQKEENHSKEKEHIKRKQSLHTRSENYLRENQKQIQKEIQSLYTELRVTAEARSLNLRRTK